MREKYIEDAVVRWAKRAGWFVRKLNWIGVTGAPDRIFIKRGAVVFIEFKRPGGSVQPDQADEHRLMAACGAEVLICDDVQQGIRHLLNREVLG